MLDAKLLNPDLACKQHQLYGPVNYRAFRESGPWSCSVTKSVSKLKAKNIFEKFVRKPKQTSRFLLEQLHWYSYLGKC